jgi:hypothetical protein
MKIDNFFAELKRRNVYKIAENANSSELRRSTSAMPKVQDIYDTASFVARVKD